MSLLQAQHLLDVEIDQLVTTANQHRSSHILLPEEFFRHHFPDQRINLQRVQRYWLCLPSTQVLTGAMTDTTRGGGVEIEQYLKLAGDKAKINQDVIAGIAAGKTRIWGVQCICGNSALYCSTADDAVHMPACSDVSDSVFVLLEHLSHWRIVYHGREFHCRSAFLANHVWPWKQSCSRSSSVRGLGREEGISVIRTD